MAQAHDRLPLDPETLLQLERTAVRLARAAGARIASTIGTPFTVHFKSVRGGSPLNSNPVSDIDRDVEEMLRAELAAAHPTHAIIGEEFGGAEAAAFTWAIDPIDGTTNFINGMPLCASSIGVLYEGWPVAGAIWCASTHALAPGVYHARRGGALCFEGCPHERRGARLWRGLAAEPGQAPRFGGGWDTRVLGSATLEFAFTAAGLLQLAYISRPSLWDAVAGLALLDAAGCGARTTQEERWVEFRRFEDSAGAALSGETLAAWCRPLLIGERSALAHAVPD